MEISLIKDLAQITFFVVMGFLGVLSYIQAKKSFFAPIKTETFKLQLAAIQGVLKHFARTKEVSILEEYDVKNVFFINFNILMNDYLRTFFPEYLINEEFLSDLIGQAVGGLAPLSELPLGAKEGHYGFAITYAGTAIPEEPALKLSHWQRYEYTLVLYTRTYSEKIDSLEQLQSNPVLPIELRRLIQKFINELEDNVGKVRNVLTKISQDLPHKFTVIQDGDIDSGWAWNEFRDSWDELENRASEINSWVDRYIMKNIMSNNA